MNTEPFVVYETWPSGLIRLKSPPNNPGRLPNWIAYVLSIACHIAEDGIDERGNLCRMTLSEADAGELGDTLATAFKLANRTFGDDQLECGNSDKGQANLAAALWPNVE